MGKITESKGSNKQKQKLFSQAGMIAVREAFNNNLPITYAEGNNVVMEYPDGRKEIIDTIPAMVTKFPKRIKIK